MVSPLDATTTFAVRVNGQDLPADQLGLIGNLTVEQNLYLPDACSITFHDATADLTDQTILPIGAEVDVRMGREESPGPIFTGEVTAHTFDIPHATAPMLVVRAYDRAHRLQRGRLSRSFLNVTDSDIATKIARESGLQPDVDGTTQVYAYVLQNNQTNWEFLQERARRIGYEIHVDGTTLRFGKPHVDASPALEVSLWDDMLRTHVHVSSVGQVGDVTVRSWDMASQQTIVGRATHGAATARGGQLQDGAALARPFGGASMIVTRYPVQSQAEADALAQALADDLAGNAVQLEAEVTGKPGLRPGQVVTLKGLGSRFSGQYYVTSATHHCGPGQAYNTVFTVSGRRSGTLLELFSGTSARGNGNGHGADGTIAIGVVTNNKDDQGLGRVKVKLPWLSDDETDWARVVAPGAGEARGFQWLPEVNDEVVIAIGHGDAGAQPQMYVLGGVWSSPHKPPKANDDVVDGSGKVTQRIIKSRSGHMITLDDTSGSGSITIVDSSGKNVITIETSSNKITLNAQGDLELKAGGTVKVSGNAISMESQGNCDIKANGNATMQAQTNCEISANGNTKVSGAAMSVEAQATCDIKGAMINLN